MINKSLLSGIVIASISALYYLYMFFVRVMPSVMTLDLMTDLQISANGAGAITASFVYAYALSQIPAGLLIDRYGPKKILVAGMTGCFLGSFLFQASTNLVTIIFSRVILGVSCSAAFIAPMAVVKQHLPSKLFSPAAGVIQVLGCVGAMLSTPIARLVSEIGWRDTGVYAVFLAIILLGLFKFAIPDASDNNKTNVEQHNTSIMKTLKQIVSDINFWHIGLLAMTSWAIIGGFAESWGVAFLAQLQGVSTSSAATQLLWMWVGVAISSPLSGFWSENTERKSLPLLTLYLGGTLAFSCVILAVTTNYFIICLLLFIAGVSAGGQIISFGLVADIAPKHILATAVSFCNVCVIAGAFAIQPIVSFLLNIFWDGRTLDGKVVYTISQYQYSFLPIIIIMTAGILASIKPPSKTIC